MQNEVHVFENDVQQVLRVQNRIVRGTPGDREGILFLLLLFFRYCIVSLIRSQQSWRVEITFPQPRPIAVLRKGCKAAGLAHLICRNPEGQSPGEYSAAECPIALGVDLLGHQVSDERLMYQHLVA